jgi:hypothetical protein
MNHKFDFKLISQVDEYQSLQMVYLEVVFACLLCSLSLKKKLEKQI